jgi:hypothetical protein
MCRWCLRPIEHHPRFGWLHVTEALFSCRGPVAGWRLGRVAEPAGPELLRAVMGVQAR